MNALTGATRWRLSTFVTSLAVVATLMVVAPEPVAAAESYRLPWDASETWQVSRGPTSGGTHSSWTGFSAWDFFPIDAPASEAHVLAMGAGSAAIVCNDGTQATVELITEQGHTFHYSHLDAASVAAAGITDTGVAVSHGADLGRILDDTNGWSEECGNGSGPHLHFEIETSALPVVIDGYTFSMSQQHTGEQLTSSNGSSALLAASTGEQGLLFFGEDSYDAYAVTSDGHLDEVIATSSGASGWDVISAIDVDGDGQDELLFYNDNGTFAYRDINAEGQLGEVIQSGTYTAGWSAITAIDLDGDGQDEIFFYRDDGLFRYYNINPDGTIGSPILAGNGYTAGWSAITAIDLDGDGQDEIFFYRADGLFRYYNINPDGTIGSPILAGNDYTPDLSSITVVQLDTVG